MQRDKLALALAVASMVPSIYTAALPPLSTVRGEGDQPAYAHAERAAGITSAVAVLAVAIVAESAEVAVLGGALAVAYALLYHRARAAGEGM